ncbi:peptidyl-prolyl cis-trans isomerase [Phyllobacterium sp. SYP-B3895]|uniref:peptidylprolyl isomerase n=1 Tax=Phyllobacterium sp. SYP-B3895 TaxID=2663240 RepID=UPI0012999E7F|nr:peptidylprolyl isomerase [Phyllobacterium sp. SYP-B3895]MRG57807.1 peptidyl-prolyl cis-trans isomerase [Phyllobacterium sp. SYP-B3895]
MNLFPIAPEPARDDCDKRRPTKAWQRWLGEPLLHFAVVGVVLFGTYRVFNSEPEQANDTQKIALTKDDVRQMAISWLAQGRSLPTEDQLRNLLDQKVTEEILSREAISLGLDRDDQIIKRRLAQKMDFLAADVASIEEPSDAVLAAWFLQHATQFALPPHASFRHLYFALDKHGGASREAAAAVLSQIAGKSPDAPGIPQVADPFMYQNHYGDATPEQMAKEFGPDYATELFKLKAGSWQGPVQSGYGWHLVWIDAIDPGRIPAFEEVRPQVKSAWIDQRYRDVKRIAFEEMRSRYTVSLPTISPADFQDLQRPMAGSSPEWLAQ